MAVGMAQCRHACLTCLSLGLTDSIKKLKEDGRQRGGERDRKGLKGEKE